VIDVENWKGYEDTSYTAKIQAKYTDLIVFNKWELCDERRFDECLDRLGDLELEVPVAWVKSDKGSVPANLVFGIDGGLAKGLGEGDTNGHSHEHSHARPHGSADGHQSEVEVLSITLRADGGNEAISSTVDTAKLEKLLNSAPKDEVYRIKAILAASSPIKSSDGMIDESAASNGPRRYILNWAFSRWTCTPLQATEEHESTSGEVLRMTMILARYESSKWKKRLESGGFVETESGGGELSVEKII